MSITELSNRFQTLNLNTEQMSSEQKIELENEKLILMKKFEDYLKTIYVRKPQKNEQKNSQEKQYMAIRRAFYYFLLLFGIVENGIGSFLFAQSILMLIPGITNLWVLGGGFLITAVQAILFYAFDGIMFKEALGIPVTTEEKNSLIDIFLEQVTTVKRINKMMFDINLILAVYQPEYQALTNLTLMINQEIENKRNTLGNYQETLSKKSIRWFVTGFGAMMCSAGTFYMATSFVTLLSPVMLGTPLGWTLIGLMMIAGWGFYFSMQGQGMVQLLNPDYMTFATLKTKLTNFDCKHENDFQLIDQVQTKLTHTGMIKITDRVVQDQSVADQQHTKTSNSRFHKFFRPLPALQRMEAEELFNMENMDLSTGVQF